MNSTPTTTSLAARSGPWSRTRSAAWTWTRPRRAALGANYINTFILGRNTSPLIGGVNSQAFTNNGNIGYRESTLFSVVPEARADVSYRVTDRLSVRAGYSFLAFTNVERPGAQIAAGPAFGNVKETFYIHGANFGATLKY